MLVRSWLVVLSFLLVSSGIAGEPAESGEGDLESRIEALDYGGLIALMAVFDHPDKFQVAYAGVPVSDLVARMGYQTQDYRDLYSAEYHVGKTAYEDVEEYRRRSPAWNASKHSFNRLDTPLAHESRSEICAFLARYLKK